MKPRSTLILSVILFFIVVFAGGALAQTALGTGFTYQGFLQESDNPANGSFDLEFQLFDATAGGSQVGDTVTCCMFVSLESVVFLLLSVNATVGRCRLA